MIILQFADKRSFASFLFHSIFVYLKNVSQSGRWENAHLDPGFQLFTICSEHRWWPGLNKWLTYKV